MGTRRTATVERPKMEEVAEAAASPARQLPLLPNGAVRGPGAADRFDGIAPGWLAREERSVPTERRPGRPDRLAVAIGAAIGARRQELGLSQTELALALGCDRSAVSRWEMGLRLPTIPNLIAIGRALGCGARALLPE